jgi:hypothetical protein
LVREGAARDEKTVAPVWEAVNRPPRRACPSVEEEEEEEESLLKADAVNEEDSERPRYPGGGG